MTTQINVLPKSLLLATLLGLASCGGGGGGGGSTATGTLSLSITDAAVDSADAVVVSFTGVTLQPADGDRITITYASPRSIDLLALNGGETELLLNNEPVDAGAYSWIRLEVDDSFPNTYIDVGLGPEPLTIPSGSQSGLKLNRGFTVAGDGSAAFTIDFDLRKSVTEAAGDYKLRPTLRIMDNSHVGAISGSIVTLNLAAADCTDNPADPNLYGAVYAFSGGGVTPDDEGGTAPDPVTTALVSNAKVDGSGDPVYTLAFLPEGDYTVAFTCDAELDDPESDTDVLNFQGTVSLTVVAGQTTEHDF